MSGSYVSHPVELLVFDTGHIKLKVFFWLQAPELVEETFYEVGKMTGRHYKLFNYHGSPTAERVAVCMGSASKTLEETVDHLNQQGENVGILNVHLFRPWSSWHFINELPKSATKLAVLDKTREDGETG